MLQPPETATKNHP